MTKIFTYTVRELVPYIHWLYFYHAWQIEKAGRESSAGSELTVAAGRLLEEWGDKRVKALFRLCFANSDGDNLLLDDTFRIPLLRRQKASSNEPNLCLSDFVRPLSTAIHDRIGLFAASTPLHGEENSLCGCFCCDDPYRRMLEQTLCDRLTEAAVERLHEEVRKRWWGYASDEQLTIEEMHNERFQGIRPAVGYPSLPDFSVNFLLDRLLDFSQIGIRLTESGMMIPHASVSGLMFSHPESRYFSVGPITAEQVVDYADRRGMPIETIKKYLAKNIR